MVTIVQGTVTSCLHTQAPASRLPHLIQSWSVGSIFQDMFKSPSVIPDRFVICGYKRKWYTYIVLSAEQTSGKEGHVLESIHN